LNIIKVETTLKITFKGSGFGVNKMIKNGDVLVDTNYFLAAKTV